MEDQKIIALFFARSEQALSALAEKYDKLCKKVARNIVKNEQDSEECVNDGYLAVWETIPPQEPDPLAVYVCRIVRNVAVNRYHANTAQKRNSFYDVSLEELEDCLGSWDDLDEEMAVRELSELLNCFLETLSQENRVLFLRRYWFADSVADIAERFQMNSNSVSARLFRLREKLRAYLVEQGVQV